MIMFGYSPLADVVVKLGTGGNTEVHLSAKVDSFTSGGVSNPFFRRQQYSSIFIGHPQFGR